MLVTPAVTVCQGCGVDGQLHAPRTTLVDLEPPVDRVEATLIFTSPQKCGTRNSALECVGSITQRVVVLIEIFLSSFGGFSDTADIRRYANRTGTASVTTRAAITIQPVLLPGA